MIIWELVANVGTEEGLYKRLSSEDQKKYLEELKKEE